MSAVQHTTRPSGERGYGARCLCWARAPSGGATLRDSVLCLPTDIHSLLVNEPPPPPPPPGPRVLLLNLARAGKGLPTRLMARPFADVSTHTQLGRCAYYLDRKKTPPSGAPPPDGDCGWKTKPLKSGGSDHAHPAQSQRMRSTRAHATERM